MTRPTQAKQEKTLGDSQQKFELVQIRRKRARVIKSACEFKAKRERELQLSSTLGNAHSHLALALGSHPLR